MVLSVVNLPDPKATDDGLEVGELVPPSVRTAREIRERVRANATAERNFMSADGRALALYVYLSPTEGARVTPHETLDAVRRVVDAKWSGGRHFSGAAFVQQTAARASREDLERLSPIVIAVLVVASAALLASVAAAAINTIVTGLCVLLALGAHGRFDEPFTIVSSSMPVMMVALGGAFGIHVLAGYQRMQGRPPERASGALRELWVPVTMSGLTTAASLFALLVMPQVPMQRYGIASALAVMSMLGIVLLVLPGLLSLLPNRWLPPQAERVFPLRARPPWQALLMAALLAAVIGSRLRADADTSRVFSEHSEPRRADAFFAEHFGGSVFVQLAIDGDLSQPVVLRKIRELIEPIRRLDGVVDVQSVLEPIAIINEALGGRRGIPETAARGTRVLTYIADHPAMAQVMTPDGKAALVHVKLRTADAVDHQQLTQQIRNIIAEHGSAGALALVSTTSSEGRSLQIERIREHLGHALGQDVSYAQLADNSGPTGSQLHDALARARDRALDSEESPVEGVPRSEIDAIDPTSLIVPRGQDLETLLRTKLPSLAARDPEGIRFVAEHLGSWVDEILVDARITQRCRALAVQDRCGELAAVLSELDDVSWGVPVSQAREHAEVLPYAAMLTGQPVLGAAFARSVTRSLALSTVASIVGLAMMLLIVRELGAIVPALWTLCITAGVISLLDHSISVGTSMVSCIAVGAGVDFGIHLLWRARRYDGPDAGDRAVGGLGFVMLVSAATLAAAFLVLTASTMPPIREFGLGLAIGLTGAAFGAVWLVPVLCRVRYHWSGGAPRR